MAPPGNKTKCLLAVNHFTKTVRHGDWYFDKDFFKNAKQQISNGIKSCSKTKITLYLYIQILEFL